MAREFLIETKALGAKPFDVVTRQNVRPGTAITPDAPMTLGADYAGIIVAVGDEVEEFTVGNRIAGTGKQGYQGGTYAEYVVTPITRLARLPDSISFCLRGL